MTAADLRATLERLNLSQMDLARKLDVNWRTVHRWIAGTTPVSPKNERAIKRACRRVNPSAGRSN
jgi:DNA-binding transcriptional regulator YiaG